MIKTRKVERLSGSCATEYSCEYGCGQDGEIECWNEYMFEWAWTGNTVECTTEEYECCDDCEEEIEECYCESEEEE